MNIIIAATVLFVTQTTGMMPFTFADGSLKIRSLGSSKRSGKKNKSSERPSLECPSVAPSESVSPTPPTLSASALPSTTPSESVFPSVTPSTSVVPSSSPTPEHACSTGDPQVLTASDCFTTFSTPGGFYVLTDDIMCNFQEDTLNLGAFDFRADDVTLDCNGNTINSNLKSVNRGLTIGVFMFGQKMKLTNCKFTNFGFGVRVDGESFLDVVIATENQFGLVAIGPTTIITNSHFDENETGMALQDGDVSVFSTSANRNTAIGIVVQDAVDLLIVKSEALENVFNGIALPDQGQSKKISNSRFCGNNADGAGGFFDIDVVSGSDGVITTIGVACSSTDLSEGCDCACPV